MCADYTNSPLSIESRIRFLCLTAAAGLSVGILFYDRLWVGMLLGVCFLCTYPGYRRRENERRKAALLLQFRDVLYALSSAISAGRPMSEALQEARELCSGTYEDKADMIQELDYMLRRIRQGQEDTLTVLRDFAERSGLADIADFVNVYEICRGSGGDLTGAINRAAAVIGDKIRIEAELKALMAQKAFESRIIALAPFAMVFLMRLTAPAYLEPMYETGRGIGITTFAGGMIACALLLTERINKIEI